MSCRYLAFRDGEWKCDYPRDKLQPTEHCSSPEVVAREHCSHWEFGYA